ncbi:MAG: gamma-glutamylcyclotransferase [Gammaproteobacteria bacterium]|jgi:gamma-glutamylcyclotransferase (GGCT)/AIG2-like uncharacterized protein YtfP
MTNKTTRHMQRLFVYGTLEFPEVVHKVLGTTLEGENAWLRGFARYLLINREYPGIIRDAGSVTEGVLYHGITPKHLRALDRYEDNIYQRQRVQVVDLRGDTVEAWAYVIPPRHRRLLSRKPWQRNAFRNKHLRRFVNVRCR